MGSYAVLCHAMSCCDVSYRAVRCDYLQLRVELDDCDAGRADGIGVLLHVAIHGGAGQTAELLPLSIGRLIDHKAKRDDD